MIIMEVQLVKMSLPAVVSSLRLPDNVNFPKNSPGLAYFKKEEEINIFLLVLTKIREIAQLGLYYYSDFCQNQPVFSSVVNWSYFFKAHVVFLFLPWPLKN